MRETKTLDRKSTTILGEKTALEFTDNIRPVLERENLAPARNKIHDLFLEHVMAAGAGL